MARSAGSKRATMLRTTALSVFTATALVATLLTAPPATATGERLDSFPKAPTDARVDGALASELEEATVEQETTASDLPKDVAPQSVTLEADQLIEGGAVGDTGITVKLLPADAVAESAPDAEDSRAGTQAPAPRVTPGPEPTAVEPTEPATPEPTGDMKVSVLGEAERAVLGGVGFAIQIEPEVLSPTADTVEIVIPDDLLAASFGADYASRIHWSTAPLSTSKRASAATPVESMRTEDGVTSLQVSTANSMVLVATSSTTSASGTGSFAATPLKPSSSWDVSAQTGAFAWSYPIPAPPAPAGNTPAFSLAYNSQLVDGSTASTNNQPSAIGEGWGLTGTGFIERRYVPCAQEQAPGVPVAGSADLCWATDNATISFDGRSGALVRDSTTGKWTLEGDDNSRVEKLIGTAQGCADNGTYNIECWRLTTTDGTKYYFGLNRLPGWTSGKATTNSAWTVPVFGNDAGDPCKASTFAGSSCQQGWRWNLDYVVDVNGNAQAYYYQAETNKYRLNNTIPTSYVRGGQLARVDYGLKASTVYSTNAATGRIVFGYDAKGRCNPANLASCSNITLGGDATTPATPSVYPDVPFDLNCTTGACTGQTSASFWTTARLATISTQTFTGGSYKVADLFTLTHSFPDPGDNQAAALWLDSVQRTGMPGTSQIVENPTSFLNVPLQNRVWTIDGLAPLDKFRISSVALPAGARISVNYSSQECTPAMAPGILASPWTNDKRCFPMWWTPDLDIVSPARQDLFHKYVVTSMIEDPYTGGGGSPTIRTNYEYTGTPGWRYVDDRLIPADRRSWSEYAGYDKVEVRVGDPATPSQQETTQYLFYRGLNGDRANASGGTKSVNVTGTSVPDDAGFGGLTRSAKVLNGAGGAVISESTTTPWTSAVTGNDGLKQSRITGVSRTDTTEPLSTGGTRTTSTINTMTTRGFVTQVSSEAGAGQPANCTTTTYAADNTTAWIIGLPSVVTDYSLTCGQVATAAIPGTVLSHKKFAYDGGAIGAAPAKGLTSETWEATGFTGTTLATATMVRSNAYAYDTMGRITSSTDAAARTVGTAYTPSATAAAGSGPVTVTTVTNPLGWTTKTTVDAYRGLPITVLDENAKTTTTDYDSLGRLTKVWRTDRPKASNPNSPSIAYEYGVFTTQPSYVKTTSLAPSGTVATFELMDGLGRTVQTQAPVVGGGAVMSDTEYDSAGRTSATNEGYWAPAVTPGTALFVPAAINQISTRTEVVYDGGGRATAQLLRSFGAEIRRTTTTYRGADRVDQVPPAGGIPTSTYTDARGQTSRTTQWLGTIDGVGVAKTSLSYEYNGRGQMTRMVDDAGNQWTWTFSQRGRQTGTTDPDAGATSFTYDELGNTLTTTDARGTTLAYTYDALNRKTTQRAGSVSGTVLASWAYDTLSKGQLTSSSRFAEGLEYKNAVSGYDNGYRPTGSTLTIPQGAPAFAGTTYTTSVYYNQDGSVAASVLPAAGGLPGEELYPSYDILGREAGLSGAAGYANDVSYLASGEVGQIVRPGTVWSALTFGYDPGTRQLTSLDETTRRNGTTFTQEALREYTRNPAGLITRASTTSPSHTADVQCFQYDGAQALKEAWTPATGDCATGPTAARGGPAPYRGSYQVDAVTGNRLTATSWTGSTATTSTYTYPTAGSARPHAVSQVSTTTGSGQPAISNYAHDAAGAMTTRGNQTLTYDASGKLATVLAGSATEKSLYTADGTLLMRWGGTDGASLFVGSTILRNTGGVVSGVRSYSVAGVAVAERVSGTGGGLWWLSPDPVGTVSLQVNASTGVVTRRWMDPFGGARGPAAAWSSPLGYLNAPKSATGLTQLGARAYDSTLGRFITVDPLLEVSEPRHANAYSYAYNSPVNFSDPTGLIPGMRLSDGGATPSMANRNASAKSSSSTPAAAGNASDAPKPQPKKEVQWWNPGSWDDDVWRTIGSVAVGVGAVAATIAIGACVVATAGICGVVGVAIGAVAMAAVGAAASAATYQLAPGPKTAEGGLQAQFTGAALGGLGGAVGVIAKPAAAAAQAGLTKVASVSSTAAAGPAAARAAGKTGEELAGVVKNTEHIPSVSGTAAYRIPDELNSAVLGEVKNVSRLSYTNQLRDFSAYASERMLQFNLYVRRGTQLSGPLQRAVDADEINLIRNLP